jgi:hypothetical protein
MKFLIYLVVFGALAFYILKFFGYTTFGQVEGDARRAGSFISHTAGKVADETKDAAGTVKDEVKE